MCGDFDYSRLAELSDLHMSMIFTTDFLPSLSIEK